MPLPIALIMGIGHLARVVLPAVARAAAPAIAKQAAPKIAAQAVKPAAQAAAKTTVSNVSKAAPIVAKPIVGKAAPSLVKSVAQKAATVGTVATVAKSVMGKSSGGTGPVSGNGSGFYPSPPISNGPGGTGGTGGTGGGQGSSSGNQSNSGNDYTSGEDDGGSGQSAVPESFTSSDDSSVSSSSQETPPIKSAPIDTVIFEDEAFAEEFLVDILFEDIIGLELLSIARGDTVNGQEVIYQPIKNLGLLQGTYNPNNILGLADTSASIFSRFVIQLNDKIPTISRGENGKNYYVDPTNGDIIIELVNIVNDEQVEIQIATSGTIDRLGI